MEYESNYFYTVCLMLDHNLMDITGDEKMLIFIKK